MHAFVPRMLVEWLAEHPDRHHRSIEGSMAQIDLSGFTRLTDRLARRGPVGAEELSDALSRVFSAMLEVARQEDADLIKWGGDAVLLLFRGGPHAVRAARCAHQMRRVLREVGRLETSAGRAVLRMSAGVHTGRFDFFLCGDPDIHRELLVAGPATTRVALLEHDSRAGQIVVSEATAARLGHRVVGARAGAGVLLRSCPRAQVDPGRPRTGPATGPDPAAGLSPAIRTHVREQPGESEHRALAVGFLRFGGVDELLTTRGPAVVAEALDRCVRTVQHATRELGVTFLESDIDAGGCTIMLVAGAPRSRGHDEERLLRAERRVLDSAPLLEVRGGVHRGHAFAGYFGPSFRRTYSVKGDVVNVAARLAGLAAPGELLATPETVAASPTAFATDDRGEMELKGKPRPVHVVSVGASRGSRVTVDAELPFVGRRAELASLRDVLEAARHRRGAVVEVVGRPGIGKTRLVQELRGEAPDLTVLSTACSTYESTTAYFPFRSLLRQAVGIPGTADAELVLRRLVDRVRDNAPQLVDWLPLLALPLDLELPSSRRTTELAEGFRKARLESVTIEFLHHVLPTPTLMVFDEAQFMDDSSVDLLRRLEVEAESRPWAVLVLRREHPAGFSATGTATSYRRLDLEPIAPGEALELLASATREAPMTSAALRTIAGRAGGNPMFLQSLALVAERTGSVVDLPESVEAVVAADIDRLDAGDRTLLRSAAVLGVAFPERWLRKMLPAPDALDRAARERLGDFLRRDGPTGLRFRHALLRDVAYEGLPFRLRKTLHDRAGGAIERESTDPDQFCELLSIHYFHAGRAERAWTYSLAAGERARAKYAHGEAIEFYERAIAAGRLAGVSDAQLAASLEALGEVREVAGLSREAADAFRLARRQAREDPVRVAELLFKEARIDHRLGLFAPSYRLLTRGRRVLASVPGPDAAVARSHLAARYSFGRYLQGRTSDAITWGRTAVREAEGTADRAAMAYAYNVLHVAHLHFGQPEDRPYGRLALAAFEEVGDLPAQAYCTTNLAIDELQAGTWGESLALLRRSAEAFARIGDAAGRANARYGEADVLVRQGRMSEALPLLEEAMQTARAFDDEGLFALALREHARALSGLGRPDEALLALVDARRRFEALKMPAEVRVVDAARGETLLRQDRPGDVLDLVMDALEGAGPADHDEGWSALRRVRGFALLALGRPLDAALAFHDAAACGDPPDGGYERALRLLGEAQAVEALGQDSAELRGRAASALERLGVVRHPHER